MRSIFIVVALITVVSTQGQQVRPAPSTKIYHELAQLKHLVHVLYVAAHPDDENTRLLGWLENDRNIRTAYLSLTRGDGGQNILGSEQGAALGLIRTHELMEARKIDGAEQYFSRAIDFGFSKNFDETFKHWNPDTVTNDAVWVMRKFRPDVVICRFPPNSQAGHGHHAASAIIGARAFKASGDKNAFPEQLAFVDTWQPKRILFNAFRFGTFSTTSEDMFKLRVGQYLPMMGMGSGELAGISRSVHKSQGAGTPSVPGEQTEYFKVVDGAPITNSLFDDIDITWGRVDRKDIGEDISDIIDHYNFLHPEASLNALLELRKKMMTVKDKFWREEKITELDRIILDCSGFMAELYAKQPQATRGATLPFTLHLISRAKIPVTVKGINWTNGDSALNVNINADTMVTFEHVIRLSGDLPYTQPYWLSSPAATPGLYTISDRKWLGMPETPNNLNAFLTVQVGDVVLKVPVPLSYKKLDPVKGDVVEPLRIVPDVTLEFTTSLLVGNPDGSLDATVRLHANRSIDNGKLSIVSNASYDITPEPQKRKEKLPPNTVDLTGDVIVTSPINKIIPNISTHATTDTLINFHIAETKLRIPSRSSFPSEIFMAYFDDSNRNPTNRCNLSQHLIQYPHIPTLQYFEKAEAKFIRNDWKCTAKRIGYIEGAGDFAPTFLRLAGLEVDVLKDGDFADAARLKKYDAIITGIRAVNVEKKMATWMPVLLQYAANGGTLILQYNTLQDLSTTKIGPYPLTLSNERVTEEDAKVTFVDPQSRLLNYPNKITNEDFEGWVQERGLYFANKWDEKYQPLFEMHDTGEKPLTGCTLYAKTGKGHYIYTTLSFSRQLPAGNKGAIRLLMNMLSVGK